MWSILIVSVMVVHMQLTVRFNLSIRGEVPNADVSEACQGVGGAELVGVTLAASQSILESGILTP
jgi:hypothetical protein